MREEVYDYLREYGFSKDKVYYFMDTNDRMFFTNLEEVKKNINFLSDKGLNKNDIIDIINDNPFMLTVKNNRLDALDNIYKNVISFNDDEICQLIKKNHDIYCESPIELAKIVNCLLNKISDIKEYLLNNSEIISMKYDDFINSCNL